MKMFSFYESLSSFAEAVNKKFLKTNGRVEQLERKVAGQDAGLKTAIQRGSLYTGLDPLDFDDLKYDFNNYTSEKFLSIGYTNCKNCPTKTTGFLTVIGGLQFWYPKYSVEKNIINNNFEIWKRTRYTDSNDSTIIHWTDWECITGINSDKFKNLLEGTSSEIDSTKAISILEAFDYYHKNYTQINTNNIEDLTLRVKENHVKFKCIPRTSISGITSSDIRKNRLLLLNCDNSQMFFVGKGSTVTVDEACVVGINILDYSLDDDGVVKLKYTSGVSIDRNEDKTTYTATKNEYWKIYFKKVDENGKDIALWYKDSSNDYRLTEDGINLVNSINLDIKEPLIEYIEELNTLKSNSNFVIVNENVENLNEFCSIGIGFNENPETIVGYPELSDEITVYSPFRVENIDMLNNGKYIKQTLTIINGDIYTRICSILDGNKSWSKWSLINSVSDFDDLNDLMEVN